MKKVLAATAMIGVFTICWADSLSGVVDNKSINKSIVFGYDFNTSTAALKTREAFSIFADSQNLFLPTHPLPISTYADMNFSEPSGYTERYYSTLTNNEKLKVLPIQTSSVQMYQVDESTQLLVPVAGASIAQNIGTYHIVMDYMKYRIEPLYNHSTKSFLVYAKIGVGMRIVANIRTRKGGVNLGSLFAIGASASTGDINGDIAVEIIGIDSPDIINLTPLTATIDQTSIQSALQALASIKSKINDPSITITPHIVAYQNPIPKKPISQKEDAKDSCILCFWRR